MEHKFRQVGQVTISLGVTQAQVDDTEDSLIERADKALYLAKNKGRNRVEVEEALNNQSVG